MDVRQMKHEPLYFQIFKMIRKRAGRVKKGGKGMEKEEV